MVPPVERTRTLGSSWDQAVEQQKSVFRTTIKNLKPLPPANRPVFLDMGTSLG